MTHAGFDLALIMVAGMACLVLAYDFMVLWAAIWDKVFEQRTVGVFAMLNLVGELLDAVFRFLRWAMVCILVLCIVALLLLLEVHP